EVEPRLSRYVRCPEDGSKPGVCNEADDGIVRTESGLDEVCSTQVVSNQHVCVM
ncbi:hypothetical protein A2U01_0081952, partial [Trifolium medium]|nr:hypothetical protein [Trifolium medium]